MKGLIEDEMVGWHHQLNGHEFEQTSGDSEAQGRAAPLASIRQMSRQVSRGSAGECQADEEAGVARLRWRVSGR